MPHQGDVRVIDVIPLPRRVAYEGRVVSVAQRLSVVDYDCAQVVQAVGAPAALARWETARRETARARGRVRVGGRCARYSARFGLGAAGGGCGSGRCSGRCFGGSVKLSKRKAFEWEGDAPARLARALVKREALEMDAEEGRRVEDAKDLWGRRGAVVSTCMHEGRGGAEERGEGPVGRMGAVVSTCMHEGRGGAEERGEGPWSLFAAPCTFRIGTSRRPRSSPQRRTRTARHAV